MPQDTSPANDPRLASPFLTGLRDCLGLPAIGLFAACCGYGVLARDTGLDLAVTLVLVGAVWAMPPLMAFVEVFAAGGGPWLIFATLAIINLRTLPMVVSTIPLIRTGHGFRWTHVVWAQLVSPTSWVQINVVGPAMPVAKRTPYFAGFGLLLLIGGLAGSWIGHAASGSLPPALGFGLLFLTPLFVLLTMATAPKFSSQASLILGCLALPALMAWDPQAGMVIGGIGAGTAGFFLGRLKSAKHQGGPPS